MTRVGIALAHRFDHLGNECLGTDRQISRSYDIQQRAALQRGRGHSGQLRVAVIEEDDAAAGVEHAQPLRHVRERGIKQKLLPLQLVVGASVADRGDKAHPEDDRGCSGKNERQRVGREQ